MKIDPTTKSKLLQGADGQEYAQQLREYLRQAIRSSLEELMEEEVDGLCGAPYHRGGLREYRRGGSDDGVFYFEGRKESIDRPRVRCRGTDGKEKEAFLKTYQNARSARNIEEDVFGLMSEGVSARGCERLSGKTISPSQASRIWVERSAGKLEELRGRDLSGEVYFGLILDGIFLSRELVVVVAMGITRGGEKKMLDFAVGSSESYEVAKDLVGRIQRRGFKCEGRLLVILDGSKALRKAVVEQWSEAIIQHCIVHKERNIHRHLRKKDHGEFSRLMARLRAAEGATAGRECLKEVREFLAKRNQAALASLEEAGEDLIALHKLEAPATLNGSLLSTNLIENAILNYRRQTKRVNRWRTETDQVDRWTATALIWLEVGFRKIRGHADLPNLLARLAVPADAVASVPSSALRAAAPSEQTLFTDATASTSPPSNF